MNELHFGWDGINVYEEMDEICSDYINFEIKKIYYFSIHH